MSYIPRIAFEVWDYEPDDWQDWAQNLQDVIGSPVAWAKKCIEAFNAEIIALNLKGADPNGRNRDVEEVINVVKDVVGAVSVPVIVWGTSNDEKDAVLLRRVAEACGEERFY